MLFRSGKTTLHSVSARSAVLLPSLPAQTPDPSLPPIRLPGDGRLQMPQGNSSSLHLSGDTPAASCVFFQLGMDFGSVRGEYAVAGLVMAWSGSDRAPRMPRIRNLSLGFFDLLLLCRDLPLLPDFLLIGPAVLALYLQATRVYCFVHQVPVCGECICFPEHQLCVVSFSDRKSVV